MKNKNTKSTLDNDIDAFDAENLNGINTENRNRELDSEILKDGEEIAGLLLRPISAGDLALLLDLGVGLLVGNMNTLFFDVGAILYSQSRSKAEIRTLAIRPSEFRAAVYDFLDEFEPNLFNEAQPKILAMIERMNKSRTALKGTLGGAGEPSSPKAGGRAG